MKRKRIYAFSLYFWLGGDILKESIFQKKIIDEIKQKFANSQVYISKLDSGYTQGVPDLLILIDDFWAMLENKKSAKASHRPNQEYYVNKFENMSFARFIFPENKDEVLKALSFRFNNRFYIQHIKFLYKNFKIKNVYMAIEDNIAITHT